MKIWKTIYLDKTFFLFLLVIILTGRFNPFMSYFFILFVHECGHAITGIVLGYPLEKITFYPYGGVTLLNLPINIPLKEELSILIMGPLFQIIGYFFLRNFLGDIKVFHYTLLFFNLLPIYPLDGGKIMNVLLGYHFSYLKCLQITFFLSIIFLLFFIGYYIIKINFNALMTLIVVLVKLIDYYRKRNYYYEKLMLERYINNFQLKKVEYIANERLFYRERFHYINKQNEKEYLKEKYKKVKFYD